MKMKTKTKIKTTRTPEDNAHIVHQILTKKKDKWIPHTFHFHLGKIYFIPTLQH